MTLGDVVNIYAPSKMRPIKADTIVMATARIGKCAVPSFARARPQR
jgi:hypothetical protein